VNICDILLCGSPSSWSFHGETEEEANRIMPARMGDASWHPFAAIRLSLWLNTFNSQLLFTAASAWLSRTEYIANRFVRLHRASCAAYAPYFCRTYHNDASQHNHSSAIPPFLEEAQIESAS
jgi:hypothetical protein